MSNEPEAVQSVPIFDPDLHQQRLEEYLARHGQNPGGWIDNESGQPGTTLRWTLHQLAVLRLFVARKISYKDYRFLRHHFPDRNEDAPIK